MRLRLRSFLLTSALSFAPAVASATTISGLYVDGGAGYNLVQVQHVHTYGGYEEGQNRGGGGQENHHSSGDKYPPPPPPPGRLNKTDIYCPLSATGSPGMCEVMGGYVNGVFVPGAGDIIKSESFAPKGSLNDDTYLGGMGGGVDGNPYEYKVVDGKKVFSPVTANSPQTLVNNAINDGIKEIKARNLIGLPVPNDLPTTPNGGDNPNPNGKLSPDEIEKLEAHAFGLGPSEQILTCTTNQPPQMIANSAFAPMTVGGTKTWCYADAQQNEGLGGDVYNYNLYNAQTGNLDYGNPQTIYYIAPNAVETPFDTTIAGNPGNPATGSGSIYLPPGVENYQPADKDNPTVSDPPPGWNSKWIPPAKNFQLGGGFDGVPYYHDLKVSYNYYHNGIPVNYNWNANTINQIYGLGLNIPKIDPSSKQYKKDFVQPTSLMMSRSMMFRSMNNLSRSFSLRHSTGFTGFAAFGWGFGNGLRSEVEGVYNFSHINDGAAEIGGQNTGQSYGGFVNALYDIDLQRLFGMRSIVTPFLGVGGGYLWQRYNNVVTGATQGLAIYGINGGFAWQGIAGFAFDTGLRGLQITAQYRMIGQPSSFMDGNYHYGTNGIAKFDQKFNHQFALGLRYAFDSTPPPVSSFPPPVSRGAPRPVVAPAPLPSRSYLVFFDWNQYALTSRARQIVVEAAHASTYVHTTRINVNGYTDSSAAPGPAGQKYNYALSVKRARSVEAELIRNGVPASEIIIRGYGDTNPLVPTAPNTREPQNRRVEIILHA